MNAIHMTMDPETGVVTLRGKSGRVYSDKEFYDAQEAVESGKLPSHPLLDDVYFDDPCDPGSLLQQVMHECPDCQADISRGIKPIVVTVKHRTRNQRKRDRRRGRN